jgi:hypothetical protein
MSKASITESKLFRIVGALEYREKAGPGVYTDDGVWHSAISGVGSLPGKNSRSGLKKTINDFRTRQMAEPVRFETGPWDLWTYRNKVVLHDVIPHTFREADMEKTVLLVKHCVLKEEDAMERIRREVQGFENFEKLPAARREMISKDVQMFVWQRDEGKCVECGSRKNLEYDHIIPVIEGGNSTSRNVQLLCQPCNRSKGRAV